MIYKVLKYFTGLALILVCLNSCDKSTSTASEKQQEEPTLTKAIGILPANGEPCSEFEPIPNDDTKVSIAFKWNAAQNAVKYELNVLLGNDQAATTTVSAHEATVTLNRGNTYSWTVTSINEAVTTISDTYSFTTPGLPGGDYAPYAAEISTEFETEAQLLTVNWIGTDEEGDDLTYDVLITEDEIVILDETDLINTSITGITYTKDTSYTINIVSKDGTGNFSISEVTINSPE